MAFKFVWSSVEQYGIRLWKVFFLEFEVRADEFESRWKVTLLAVDTPVPLLVPSDCVGIHESQLKSIT